MKRVGLILMLGIILSLPCHSITLENVKQGDRLVFVYHIPDDDEQQNEEQLSEDTQKETQDIISDDITADTSIVKGNNEQEDYDYFEDEDYFISDMYTDVLKGYAVYNEEDENEDIITLNPELEAFVLNIKKPISVKASKYTNLKLSDSLYDNIYTKLNGSEYSIAPMSNKHTDNLGYGLSTGTLYEQEISYGELEQSSGVFSRYEHKRFALTTAYTKTVNTTNNNYNDKFAITPEFKLNQYMTLKQKLSADTVKKRKKAELILSVNPFGKKDNDRLRFDFTVGETYDEVSNTFWNRYEFNTIFKL